MIVDYRILAMLSRDVFGYICHWSGSKKSDHDHYVKDRAGLKLSKVTGHAGTGKLEHAHGLAASQHIICFFIIPRQVININLLPGGFLNNLHGMTQDREIANS